jgi:hypothetical protein
MTERSEVVIGLGPSGPGGSEPPAGLGPHGGDELAFGEEAA